MEPSGTRARFLGNLLSVMQGPRAPAGVTVLPRLAGGPPGSQHGNGHVCAPRPAGLGSGGDEGGWRRRRRRTRALAPPPPHGAISGPHVRTVLSTSCTLPAALACLDDSGPRLRAFEKAVGPPSLLLVTHVVTVAHHVGTHERAESVSRQPHKHVSPWGLTRDTAHTAPEPRVRFNSLNEEH